MTRRRSAKPLLVLTVATSLLGCSQPGRYAVLYVASDPPLAEVISTNDGQHLDDGTGTPSETIFTRDHMPYPGGELGLLVYRECYRPFFQFVKIDKWYDDLETARINGNNVMPRLSPINAKCRTVARRGTGLHQKNEPVAN
jgi:hypothetical protein